MLLVAVMEPDVGDSLPRIGDDHWFRFYVILGANGALAFLVSSWSLECRSPLWDVPRQLHLAGCPCWTWQSTVQRVPLPCVRR